MTSPPQAFVRFESLDDQKAALQKDRETFGLEKFGDRYVRVYPALETDLPDMQQAVVQQSMVLTVREAAECCHLAPSRLLLQVQWRLHAGQWARAQLAFRLGREDKEPAL